jgi:hypothetical protein
MPDTRFKDKNGFCKLCHKVCYESKSDVLRMINSPNSSEDMKNNSVYECNLYPSGYWHHTRGDRPDDKRWKIHVFRLGVDRSQVIFNRIEKILRKTKRDSQS